MKKEIEIILSQLFTYDNDGYLNARLNKEEVIDKLQALVDRAVVAERERVVDEILDFYKDSEFLAEYLSQLTDSEK